MADSINLESIGEGDQYEVLKAQIERGNAKIKADWGEIRSKDN